LTAPGPAPATDSESASPWRRRPDAAAPPPFNHRKEAMLNERQERLCAESRWDFSDLSALFLNCTLKRSPELSHTEGLIRISRAILEKNGVSVELLRPVDYEIASGVYPDMREHGWDRDDWPEILEKVLAADILVIGTSIWLGEKTSVATRVAARSSVDRPTATANASETRWRGGFTPQPLGTVPTARPPESGGASARRATRRGHRSESGASRHRTGSGGPNTTRPRLRRWRPLRGRGSSVRMLRR